MGHINGFLNVFFSGQLPGFFFQHDRDVVADRIGQAVYLTDQLLLLPVIDQRALANRAGEYIE